jgi:hypothetical protein
VRFKTHKLTIHFINYNRFNSSNDNQDNRVVFDVKVGQDVGGHLLFIEGLPY